MQRGTAFCFDQHIGLCVAHGLIGSRAQEGELVVQAGHRFVAERSRRGSLVFGGTGFAAECGGGSASRGDWPAHHTAGRQGLGVGHGQGAGVFGEQCGGTGLACSLRVLIGFNRGCVALGDGAQHVGAAAFDCEIGALQVAVFHVHKAAACVACVAVGQRGPSDSACLVQRKGHGDVVDLEHVCDGPQAVQVVAAQAVGGHRCAVFQHQTHACNADFIRITQQVVIAVGVNLAHQHAAFGEHTAQHLHGHAAFVAELGQWPGADRLCAVDAVALQSTWAHAHAVAECQGAVVGQ